MWLRISKAHFSACSVGFISMNVNWALLILLFPLCGFSPVVLLPLLHVHVRLWSKQTENLNLISCQQTSHGAGPSFKHQLGEML